MWYINEPLAVLNIGFLFKFVFHVKYRVSRKLVLNNVFLYIRKIRNWNRNWVLIDGTPCISVTLRVLEMRLGYNIRLEIWLFAIKHIWHLAKNVFFTRTKLRSALIWKKVRKKVFNCSELHLLWSDWLQNSYFRYLCGMCRSKGKGVRVSKNLLD